MRKCKFITGTISLTLAVAVGITSFAQLSGQVTSDVFVYEYETLTSEPVVEKSANEVNVLMDTGIKNGITVDFMELESSARVMDNVVVNVAKGEIILENMETESESKETVKHTKKVKAKKKNTKKTNNTETENENLEYMGNYKITAYCACSACCGKSNGITASGTKATAGRTIAADTSVLPFGTQVVIDGHTYTVEDRGGAISGNKIDVFFNSHSEALNFGVRYCDVYVQK